MAALSLEQAAPWMTPFLYASIFADLASCTFFSLVSVISMGAIASAACEVNESIKPATRSSEVAAVLGMIAIFFSVASSGSFTCKRLIAFLAATDPLS